MQCEKAQSTGPQCSQEKLKSEFKWRMLNVKVVQSCLPLNCCHTNPFIVKVKGAFKKRKRGNLNFSSFFTTVFSIKLYEAGKTY